MLTPAKDFGVQSWNSLQALLKPGRWFLQTGSMTRSALIPKGPCTYISIQLGLKGVAM